MSKQAKSTEALQETLKKNIPAVGIKVLKDLMKRRIGGLSVKGPKKRRPLSLLIVGNHAVGKSEVVFQVAEECGYKVIDKRFSCLEVGDLVGLSEKSADGKSTINLKPDWFPSGEGFEKTILFLDEFVRANRDIKNAAMQIVLDRRLNGWKLPADCMVVAAINDGDLYDMVGGLDVAQQSRFQMVELAPTVAEWLEWAAGEGGVSYYVTQFISNHPTYLDPPPLHEDDGINRYPDRRAWVALADEITSDGKKPQVRDIPLMASYVGMVAGAMFVQFCDAIIEKIDPLEILSGKDCITGKESLYRDITKISPCIDELLNVIKGRYDDGTGKLKPKGGLTAAEMKSLEKFFAALIPVNPEAAALLHSRIFKNVLGIEDLQTFLEETYKDALILKPEIKKMGAHIEDIVKKESAAAKK